MPARLTYICITCKRDLPSNWFWKNSRYQRGYMSRCKDCCNVKRRRPGATPRDGLRPDGTRRCSQCREFKQPNEFTTNRGSGSGRHYVCDSCRPAYQRAVYYRHQYGIDLIEFDAILTQQCGCCAACGDILDASNPKGRHLDHCHVTNRIRGILCHHCNVALGHLRDDPQRIYALLRYLEGDQNSR